MVTFTHDGLEMWYATPDAPAPDGSVEDRTGISVTVGVHPARPGNAVRVHYRIDGRNAQSIAAPLVRSDYGKRVQYFRARLPALLTGETVEYVPLLSSAGRRVPDAVTADSFPSSFRLGRSPERLATPARQPDVQHNYPLQTEYLGTSQIMMARRPDVVGETPAGFVVNWAPAEGTFVGPSIRATVHQEGEHEMVIRPDGIGILSVRVTLETDDHALISVRYSAVVDLGPDGAQWARQQHWPAVASVRSAPRLLTSHAQYQWLNRLQCVGVGEVRAAELRYTYDLYALR